VRALADGPYVPVPLDEICNAAGPVDAASLPAAGQETLIEGIPFVFPKRDRDTDHVDVGESLFDGRLDQVRGYQLTHRTWPSPDADRPTRIMLRVPKHAYRRAWLIAAADGEPYSTPVVTLRFFRVGKGWPLDSALRVPEFTAATESDGARRIPVTMIDGTAGSLWLLPVDIDSFWLASDFREVETLSVELTKEVKDFRSYPIPANYGSYQAGLPSAVRVYGLTLEKAPVAAIASSDRAGNLYTDPEKPTWLVHLASQSEQDAAAEVTVALTDPYGERTTYRQTVSVPAGGRQSVRFDPHLGKYGLHEVQTTVTCRRHVQSREGALLWMPPDRRKADGKTTRWGLWNWGGGHGTNRNAEDNLRLSYAIGARTGSSFSYEDRKKWGVGPRVPIVRLQPRGQIPAFALQDPYDPAEYARFSDDFGKRVAALREGVPDLEYVTTLGEPRISQRVSYGVPPYAFGLPWFEYTESEREKIRGYLITFGAACEGVRKHAPGVKFLFGWGEPQFPLAFFRERFPNELFDGFGLQSRLFETMPERPPRRKEFSLLYFLKPEMKRWGYEDKELVHTESYFPSSHRLGLGHRGQADHVVRSAVLSLALGTDRFIWSWTLHDCEDYWGTQHYGCSGMIGRRPEYNPKLAASAFATMTQLLDSARYDGYLPTGSRSAYCVRFKRPDALVYCLWTLRGSRPITLRASSGSQLSMVDESGNETPLALSDARTTLGLSPTPIWVVAHSGKVREAAVGRPTHAEPPGPHRIVLDDFERRRWTRRRGDYDFYAKNNWDMVRRPGPIQAHSAYSPERKSRVLRVRLAKTQTDKAPFVGWYCVYEPVEPLFIPGKARALGVRANGNSGWGRIIYELVDARGELFLNCGAKDSWFGGDLHSWSHFNFDGWRYMEFPLPGNSPGDNYREKDSVWWGHSAEGVVDLPLRLNKIIFQMQTHQIYVNEVLPCESLTVELDDLMAVYDSAEMMTDKPVEVQRAAADIIK